MQPLIKKVLALFTTAKESPSKPVPFGHKTAWVAVRSNDANAVAAALSLSSRREAGWQAGVIAAYEYPAKEVFVTPPMGGWVCVIGLWLSESIDITEKNLAELSTVFGEAHAYANHRVVGLAQWILAKDGKIVRCYSYLGESGEVTNDTGEPTAVELKLRPTVDSAEDWYPDEDDVMAVASARSFDPSKLSADSGPPALGVLGIAG